MNLKKKNWGDNKHIELFCSINKEKVNAGLTWHCSSKKKMPMNEKYFYFTNNIYNFIKTFWKNQIKHYRGFNLIDVMKLLYGVKCLKQCKLESHVYHNYCKTKEGVDFFYLNKTSPSILRGGMPNEF